MPNFVPDSGPLTAKVLVIGDAPEKDDLKRRRPFMGRHGQRLTEFTKKSGIDRLKELRLTYVSRELEQTIQKMPNLQLIVPMGPLALREIHSEVTATITQVRGSVYQRGPYLVLSMVHPKITLFDDRWTRACLHDWKRARLLMDDPQAYQPVRRTHEIMPSMARIKEYLREVQSLAKTSCMGVDIETPKKITEKIVGYYKKGTPKKKRIEGKRFIACIAFSTDPLHSLTIPLTRSYWKRQLPDAWDVVEALCATKVSKVFHNGMFDTWHLMRVGIRTRNWRWDTKDMHHALDAWDQHSLGYCASVDTWEPYWKDEGKTKGMPLDLEKYWIYNGKDSAVTRELKDTYEERLREMPS